MKKNNMLRIASVLLVAVLLSTCAVSGVFAHYRTTGNTNDSAKVAKWGVTIDATTDAVTGKVMFSDSYKDKGTVYDAAEVGRDITVQADTEGTNVVAPGTEGTLAKFAITGTPEVDVEVTYDAELTLTGWMLDASTYYCPIVITVNGTPITINYDYAGADNALIDFQNRVNAAIEQKTKTYDANTDLSCVEDDVVVTWAWAYDADNYDKDTALGNQAAGINDGVASEIALTITTTITQID